MKSVLQELKMSKVLTEIGAYEAKTRLPELLRAVQQGAHYVITNRGLAVAELVPVGETKDVSAAVAGLKALMSQRIAPEVDIKALIDEGRA